MLEVGKKAPQFTLPDSDGNNVSLKDYLGQKVVLFFYPKDNTPGCTQEACDFRDSLAEFNKIKIVVLGVSKDSKSSHIKFRDKFDLNFPLLSDVDTKVIQQYGIWKEKSMYGKKYMGVERSTFLIDEKSKIEKIYTKVKATNHVSQILSDLKK